MQALLGKVLVCVTFTEGVWGDIIYTDFTQILSNLEQYFVNLWDTQ